MAGSYGAFRSKSGQVFKFRIDRLWKAVLWEGWREKRRGGVARVHPGGYVFIFRLCDVSGVGRNQKFRDTRCGRSHVSFVALRSFVVQRRIAFVEGEQVFTGESSSCFDTLRLATVSERILSEIVYENYSRTITILRLLFSPSFFHTKWTCTLSFFNLI